jgi:hypothetical protein
MLRFLLGLLLLFGLVPVFAASSNEPDRFVNAQGIEIIQPRAALVTGEAKLSAPGEKPAGKAAPGVVAASFVSASAEKLRVSAKEQQNRDKDRLTILNQELQAEMQAYQTKWKAVHATNAKNALSAEDMAKLQQQVGDHENNIQALQAEIRRANNANSTNKF